MISPTGPHSDTDRGGPAGPALPSPVRDGVCLLVPPERLYWAILEPTPRANTEALRYALEPWLPVRIEGIETRFHRLPDGRVVACGIEQSTIAEWIETEGDDIEAIVPSGRPALLPDPIDEQRINFRTGSFASPRARRRNRHQTLLIGAALSAIVAFLFIGMQVRTQASRAQAATAHAATLELIEAVTSGSAPGTSRAPGTPGSTGTTAPSQVSAIDPRLRLASELRIAQQTRQTSGLNTSSDLPESRTSTIMALLAAWPDEIPCRVDRLQVDQQTLSISGAVLEPADYQRLVLALRDFSPAWLEPTGDTSRTRDEYTFSLIFKRRPFAGVGVGVGVGGGES